MIGERGGHRKRRGGGGGVGMRDKSLYDTQMYDQACFFHMLSLNTPAVCPHVMYGNYISRSTSQVTYQFHMPVPHASSTCQFHMPGLHTSSTCQFHMPVPHASSTCQFHMPGLHTSFCIPALNQHIQRYFASFLILLGRSEAWHWDDPFLAQ